MPSSEIWSRVDFVRTVVSEEHVVSIFWLKKSTIEEKLYQLADRLNHRSKKYQLCRTGSGLVGRTLHVDLLPVQCIRN
jgi:hypothetical protein